jgi:hypothetical protein
MSDLTAFHVILSPVRNSMRKQSLLKAGFHSLLLTPDAGTSIIPGLPAAIGAIRSSQVDANHTCTLEGTCRLISDLKTSIDAPDRRIP